MPYPVKGQICGIDYLKKNSIFFFKSKIDSKELIQICIDDGFLILGKTYGIILIRNKIEKLKLICFQMNLALS